MAEIIQMPAARFPASSFTLVHPSSQNRLRSGAVLGSRIAPSFWQASLTTALLNRTTQGQWQSFFDQVGHGNAITYLHDPARKFPVSFSSFVGVNVAGGGAFDGAGNLFAITDLVTIDVNQLPSFFVLKQGDYFGIDTGTRKSLHRITSDVVGSAGGEASIEFLPPMSLSVETGASIVFEKPEGEFVIDQSSIKGLESSIDENRVSFSATSRAE
ncbi:hypothetical protein [Maritalea sp.]|jgi:hypothetical protein|uniref:hypothetical protein n=1 Tax=Maritalea sp. TaxID=2003361 RepID=UPI0039E39773